VPPDVIGGVALEVGHSQLTCTLDISICGGRGVGLSGIVILVDGYHDGDSGALGKLHALLVERRTVLEEKVGLGKLLACIELLSGYSIRISSKEAEDA